MSRGGTHASLSRYMPRGQAKDELVEVVQFLRSPDKFQVFGCLMVVELLDAELA